MKNENPSSGTPSREAVYECKALYNAWLGIGFLIGFPLLFIAFVVQAIVRTESGINIVMAVVWGLLGIFFLIIMPKRYQLFADKTFRIDNWLGFSVVQFRVIRAEPIDCRGIMSGCYLKLNTSFSGNLLLVREKGWDVVISVSNQEALIESIRTVNTNHPSDDDDNDAEMPQTEQ